jgi:hypothetical protein
VTNVGGSVSRPFGSVGAGTEHDGRNAAKVEAFAPYELTIVNSWALFAPQLTNVASVRG